MMNTQDNDDDHLPVTIIHETATVVPTSRLDRVSNKNQIAQILNQKIINHVQEQIMQNKLIVSPKNNQFHSPTSKIQSDESSKFYEIIKRKKELDNEMNRLKYQQSRLRDTRSKTIEKRKRSQFTKEEHMKILKAIEAQKQLEELEKRKIIDLQLSIQKERIEREEIAKRKRQQTCKQRQIVIEASLFQLQKRRQEREKMLKELNKNYSIVKSKTFLHETKEKQWNQKLKRQQKEQRQYLLERKKNNQFSMKNIFEHQQKYKTFTNQKILSSEAKIKKNHKEKIMIQRQTLNRFKPSKFLETIKQVEQHLKKQQLQKSSIVKRLIQTKVKYGDDVRLINRQNMKMKVLPPINELNQDEGGKNTEKKAKKSHIIEPNRSLSRLQIAEIGNKYLRQVHSSIGTIQFSRKSPQNEPIQYKQFDYLQELKRKRSQNSLPNPESKQIRQLKNVLKKKTSDEEKLFFAKIIANKMHQRAKSDTKMLLNSINAKIAILDTFSS